MESLTNIYIIHNINQDTYKIGKSKDVKKRKSSIQTGNHNHLIIEYIVRNVPDSFEKVLHNACVMYKIRGEWFNDKVIGHLKQSPLWEHIEKYK